MAAMHRRFVPHCKWRNAIAVFMAAVTAGAWIPFLPADPFEPRDDDEELTLPMRQVLPPMTPTPAEKMFPRPVDLIKKPKPVKSPSVDPTFGFPTPQVPVHIHPKPTPTPTHTPAPSPKPVVHPTTPPPVEGTRVDTLVDFLRAQVGKAYVFGGNGPNAYDCSGLTQTAFARIGVSLPRTSQAQSFVGVRVPLSTLRPGDLVFWGKVGVAFHVGVYVGGGRIIAAQNAVTGVISFTLDYYMPSFARRVL